MATSGTTLRGTVFGVVAWCAFVGSAVMTIAMLISAPMSNAPFGNSLSASAVSAVGAVLAFRATRMRVEVGDEGVAMVGLFSTRRLTWTEIATVSVDYFGLHMMLRTGEDVTAYSLGKSNWSKWRRKRSDADDAVEVLRRELEAHRY